MSKRQKLSIQVLFSFLLVGDASRASGVAKEEENEEVSTSSTKPIMLFANTFEHTIVFLKGLENEHVSMNLVSLSKTSNPHQFRDLAKHCVLWERVPYNVIIIVTLTSIHRSSPLLHVTHRSHTLYYHTSYS